MIIFFFLPVHNFRHVIGLVPHSATAIERREKNTSTWKPRATLAQPLIQLFAPHSFFTFVYRLLIRTRSSQFSCFMWTLEFLIKWNELKIYSTNNNKNKFTENIQTFFTSCESVCVYVVRGWNQVFIAENLANNNEATIFNTEFFSVYLFVVS